MTVIAVPVRHLCLQDGRDGFACSTHDVDDIEPRIQQPRHIGGHPLPLKLVGVDQCTPDSQARWVDVLDRLVRFADAVADLHDHLIIASLGGINRDDIGSMAWQDSHGLVTVNCLGPNVGLEHREDSILEVGVEVTIEHDSSHRRVGAAEQGCLVVRIPKVEVVLQSRPDEGDASGRERSLELLACYWVVRPKCTPICTYCIIQWLITPILRYFNQYIVNL